MTEEPGLLQSRGSQRVRHDLAAEQQHLSYHMCRDKNHNDGIGFHLFFSTVFIYQT